MTGNEGSILKEKISRGQLIRLGGATGVSVAGASVLSACGGGSGNSGSASGSASSSAASSSASTGSASDSASSSGSTSSSASDSSSQQAPGGENAIARTSDVAPGSAVKFKDSGKPALLVHLDSGDFAAFSAVCTHQGCTVAYRGGQLACPCHGSIFDASNGQVVNPPAQQPLPKIPIEVRQGEVFRA